MDYDFLHTLLSWKRYIVLQYDTIEEFNVDSKAGYSA